jgi:hypothetical protein
MTQSWIFAPSGMHFALLRRRGHFLKVQGQMKTDSMKVASEDV